MGTAKTGAHSATTTRHQLVYIRPAGVVKTLLTVQDATRDGTVDQESMHGDGSVAPICVVNGFGSVEWKFSLAEHEYRSAIVAVAKAANIPIQGEGGLLFNYVRSSTVAGLPKSTSVVKSASIGSDSDSVQAEGNRVELGGMAQNEELDGVLRFKEAQ
jgi:hypothetical protein